MDEQGHIGSSDTKKNMVEKYSYNRNERTRNPYKEVKHIASREWKQAKLDYKKQIQQALKTIQDHFGDISSQN